MTLTLQRLYQVEVWGRINGELAAKLDAACEYLRYRMATSNLVI